jgi:nitronate monooxygenase
VTGFDTAATDLLGVDRPVVQAPIGSATCPELAAAVADAGGLGHLAVTWRDREETRRVVGETAAATDGRFAVNLVLDERTGVLDPAEHVETVLDAGAEVVSFSFGEAAPHVATCHDAGATVLQTVTDADSAREAESAGVDCVVTQGWEAGGHVQGEVATMPLVPRVADAVDVPVVAAGGIADGRGLAAALALGADAAWLGTRFLATEEARVHRAYRDRVLAASESETAYTELFDKGWPGMPHRVVENETVERWRDAGEPTPGERPGETDTVARTGDGEPVERYDEALATPEVSGDVDAMALFAGQSAGLTRERRPAGEVVTAVVSEAAATLDGLDELRWES